MNTNLVKLQQYIATEHCQRVIDDCGADYIDVHSVSKFLTHLLGVKGYEDLLSTLIINDLYFADEDTFIVIPSEIKIKAMYLDIIFPNTNFIDSDKLYGMEALEEIGKSMNLDEILNHVKRSISHKIINRVNTLCYPFFNLPVLSPVGSSIRVLPEITGNNLVELKNLVCLVFEIVNMNGQDQYFVSESFLSKVLCLFNKGDLDILDPDMYVNIVSDDTYFDNILDYWEFRANQVNV